MEKRFRAPFSPRISKNKPPRKRFVIVCEGERTETDYFHHLKDCWKSRFKEVDKYVSIDIMPPSAAGGNEPPNLIDYAMTMLQETEKARNLWDKSSEIWCVFDVEAEKRRKNLKNRVASARKRKIQLAISNPCLELWFYLHFHYCETAFETCDEMEKSLQKCWPDYGKSNNDFSALEGKYKTARQNAEQLRKSKNTKRNPSDPVPRPHTDVDKLITKIEAVLKDLP